MKNSGLRRALAATLAAATLVGIGPPTESSVGATAHAEPMVNSSFAGDFELPQRWNDDYKPGTECATPGEAGVWVSAKRRWFKQTDAASVANRNEESIPVSHSVTNKRTQTLEVSGQAKGEGDLAKYATNAFGFNYVHQVHWSLEQTVGPYELPSGRQGKLVWGFTILDTDNQNVECGVDQVWHSQGEPYSASIPEARYSELRLDDAPVWDA